MKVATSAIRTHCRRLLARSTNAATGFPDASDLMVLPTPMCLAPVTAILAAFIGEIQRRSPETGWPGARFLLGASVTRRSISHKIVAARKTEVGHSSGASRLVTGHAGRDRIAALIPAHPDRATEANRHRRAHPRDSFLLVAGFRRQIVKQPKFRKDHQQGNGKLHGLRDAGVFDRMIGQNERANQQSVDEQQRGDHQPLQHDKAATESRMISRPSPSKPLHDHPADRKNGYRTADTRAPVPYWRPPRLRHRSPGFVRDHYESSISDSSRLVRKLAAPRDAVGAGRGGPDNVGLPTL